MRSSNPFITIRNICIISVVTLFTLVSCNSEIPTVGLGLDEYYQVARLQKLLLQPSLTGEKYKWYVNGELVAETRDYVFMEPCEGTYQVRLEIEDTKSPITFDMTIKVYQEEIEYSPYITKVHEYCPAPGQYVNEMPVYEDGDTAEDMRRKAEESISGTNNILISLGGFGGYVVFGFDHTVPNIPGEKDFLILGNSFYQGDNTERKGGSSEPGIVEVSYDVNCNGIADDPWYELAGSEYYKSSTTHGYSITYYLPDKNHTPTPGSSAAITDQYYISWEDSEGMSGYMPKTTFHTQEYYPLWINQNSLSFKGTRLADNGVEIDGFPPTFTLFCLDWGYADNYPNTETDLNSFDISWAVDYNGNPVNLPGIDFVRVYTGMNQYCGRLGETSTEICHAQDLHIQK